MSKSAMARYSETLSPDPRVSEVAAIVNEVLGASQVCLTLMHLSLDEDIPTQQAVVKATIEIEKEEGTREVDIEGRGVGLLDAFFEGLVTFFSKEYFPPIIAVYTLSNFSCALCLTNSQDVMSSGMAYSNLSIPTLIICLSETSTA